MFFGASGDTYGDVARLLARHRAAGPGIRRARVVASRARAAFSGSRVPGGGMGTPAYRGCPLRDAPGSGFAGGATNRSAAKRATDVEDEDHPFRVYAGWTLVLRSRCGAGLATFPPSEKRPGLLLAFIHPSVWKGDSATFALRGF